MSTWEFFTWLSVAVLAAGSVLVFVAFLRQLPAYLRRGRPPTDDVVDQ